MTPGRRARFSIEPDRDADAARVGRFRCLAMSAERVLVRMRPDFLLDLSDGFVDEGLHREIRRLDTADTCDSSEISRSIGSTANLRNCLIRDGPRVDTLMIRTRLPLRHSS
ncbi:MAG: hypothetical protein JWN86_302 [Planctomycetota bacterium]|nr:hypothetical protein [Planctomycetota bacterium]